MVRLVLHPLPRRKLIVVMIVRQWKTSTATLVKFTVLPA
eukprot:COSAG02_NODE_8339_length_2608_cov_2.116381_4_plen_39_part_00